MTAVCPRSSARGRVRATSPVRVCSSATSAVTAPASRAACACSVTCPGYRHDTVGWAA